MTSTFPLFSATNRFRFGAHMPTAGGLHKAVTGGYKIGSDTVQVFTASPRQWNAPPLKPESVRAFRRAVEKTGLYPLIAHDSYLINLATQDPALLEKSRNAFKHEMERAETLGLDYLVTHMGAHTGAGEEAGMTQLSASLDWLHEQLPDVRVRVALETTAGQGTCLGGSFAHFAQIVSGVKEKERVMACLDTCHIFVAGYDYRTAEQARAVLDEFDANVGMNRLICIHANDTDKKCGSRSDRHTHIGDGEIGYAGFSSFFERLKSYPNLPDTVAVVVETPETDTMVAENVYRIKRLGTA
ncbi:MAG: deoxyribonuclease IV [Fibrella sp.]|nr:deoxyribonuclease IV [Armatimonadota bacterium]